MLTVKMIHGSGEEIVFEATQVRRDPDGERAFLTITPPDGADLITYPIRPSSEVTAEDFMAFYVMNRHGATVAHYSI